jgi:hypothetical protein
MDVLPRRNLRRRRPSQIAMEQTKVLLVDSLQRIDGLLICGNLVPSGKNYDDFHSMPG